MSLPKKWFTEPLRSSMRKLVRPCTSLTRRKQLQIKLSMPRAAFEDLLQGLPMMDEPNGVDGLQRDAQQMLIPTRSSRQLLRFNYTLSRPSHLERAWRLQDFDGRDPNSRARSGRRRPQRAAIPYKRGLGSARLMLSQAAGKRGVLSRVLAMVCGNVLVEYKEPTMERRMGQLKLSFFVLSMDSSGHIIWPTNFGVRTQGALRLQARTFLKRMLDDPLYPTDEAMRRALTQSGSSLLRDHQVARQAARRAAAAAQN